MDRRNFLKGAAAGTSAIVMGGLLSACTQSTSNNEQESPKFTAGTYTATALGRTGNVTVETVFTDTEISSINVTENGDTEVISQPAVDLTPIRIIEAQSLGVDAITGSTLTSTAIIEAVKDCAKQAGADMDSLCAKAPEPIATQKTLDADILIVGAGGAGMSAAYTAAAEEGAQVLLLEKTSVIGGSSRLNSGYCVIPATDEEAAEHDACTAEELYDMFKAYAEGSPYFNDDIVRDLFMTGTDRLEFYASLGYDYERYVEMGWMPQDPKNPDGPVNTYVDARPTGLEGIDGVGWHITEPLREACIDAGVEIITDTAVTDILVDDAGKIIGAKAMGYGNIEYTINAKAVILACGGFGANSDMMKLYVSNASIPYAGGPGNTGDGLFMAGALNAKPALNRTPVHAGKTEYYNTIGGLITDETGCVIDNEDGTIPGLYAAGELTNILWNWEEYPAGGTSVHWNAYSGRIAARSAATFVNGAA